MSDVSLADELSAWRKEFAETYRRYVPDWSGEAYSTHSEYPSVPVGPDFTDANNARTAVYACDSLLWILQATQSDNGYVFSERRLEDFTRWYSLVASFKEMQITRPTFSAGVKAIRLPETARNSKAIKDAQRKHEQRCEAERAFETAKRQFPEAGKSLLADKAADSLGISRSAFYARRRPPK
jgi:hypothetical protein